jgi:hypothetical protein
VFNTVAQGGGHCCNVLTLSLAKDQAPSNFGMLLALSISLILSLSKDAERCSNRNKTYCETCM